MTIHDLNTMDQRQLRELLHSCCGSEGWSKMMLTHFPAEDLVELLDNVEEVWNECSEEEWIEAFSQHPRIGDIKTLKEKYSGGPEAGEQSSINSASPETLAALQDENRRYEEKFGFIFIVSAKGKSAEDMLNILRQRIENARSTEIRIAADEQLKITKLRIEKMLGVEEGI